MFLDEVKLFSRKTYQDKLQPHKLEQRRAEVRDRSIDLFRQRQFRVPFCYAHFS